MINYKTIKESDTFRRPYHDDNLYTVQLIELDSSYIVKDELPCYWLVGVVGYIDYKDQFVGAIHHFSSQRDAEDKYSELCERYSVEEKAYDEDEQHLRELQEQGLNGYDKIESEVSDV